MKQLSIFDVATQEDRLEVAYQILASVRDEMRKGSIKWESVQKAVNCQCQINRIVFMVNERFFDADEEDEEDYCNSVIPRVFQDFYTYREPVPNIYINAVDNGAPMLECPGCKARIQANAFSYAVGNMGYQFCPYCGKDVRKKVQSGTD